MNAPTKALVNLSSAAQTVVIQWVPAHCDIRGNERSDRLAKEEARNKQPDELVSFVEIKTIIKAQEMAAAASCMLPRRQLSFADSRGAGQNLLTEDWPQWREPPLTNKVWHWTDWQMSLQHRTADSRPHTPDMPNVRSCLRQHLAITHKPGEETLQLTGGSSGNGCTHLIDWVGYLSHTNEEEDLTLQIKLKEQTHEWIPSTAKT